MSRSAAPSHAPTTLPPLKEREFRTLVRRLAAETGIELADSKRGLVAGRLNRRLVALGLASFRDYVAWLDDDPSGNEVRAFVNALTTNQTAFFRDAEQLEWLAEALPSIVQAARQRGVTQLRAWSAACSTGEEPYTLAMLLQRATEQIGTDFRVLATDIDTDVLRQAAHARYPGSSRSDLPRWATRFVRDEPDGGFAVSPVLRQRVVFRQLNLVSDAFRFQQPVDLVLCRNVFIYFSEQTKQAVATKLASHLPPGGYFLVGHAESLRNVPSLRFVRNNVYVRTDSDR